MTQIAIRQSGGASIISIPKAILEALSLHIGSKLDLSVVNSKILLTPIKQKETLEDLLAGTPKKKLQITNEDHEWLENTSVGKEI